MNDTSVSENLAVRLRAGNALGAWCGFASFSSVELMTLLGFDFLVFDMQHCEIGMQHIPALLGPFGSTATFPVVRAPQNSYQPINWLLDQGVAGVVVPMVNSVADARRAVEAAKYPPVGKRSFGPFRAARYGTQLARYIPDADETATLIVQIEDATAARDIDSILQVSGIDAVLMGPNDLAYSMLKPGQTMRGNPQEYTAFARTPEVLGLCAHVLERCRSAGLPFGMTTGSLDEAQQWFERGASFAMFGSDFLFLRTGAEHLCGVKMEKK
jgi:2-keto-3-deoxy-L-rhamnonate aldolase RhmA